MPQGRADKARIALLIMIAVVAIAVAMLEALADNPPSAATAAPSRAPSAALSTLPNAPADELSYPRSSGLRASE